MSAKMINTVKLITALAFCSWVLPSSANTLDNNTNVNSIADLDWGVVLYEYYQRDYFNALVEYEYSQAIKNPIALSGSGLILKGGMQLSYGMADESKKLFTRLLASNASELDKNRAWFYLAKLYYFKSEPQKASNALNKVKGELPEELQPEFYYMATLIQNDGQHLHKLEDIVQSLPQSNPYYPYLLFNLGIAKLKVNDLDGAVSHLELVTAFGNRSQELAVLSDRARHGLAQLAVRNGKVLAAWNYLKSIRTTGIYSNRALLTYSWSAIKLKQFNSAIPALKILDDRSITIPEVQEAKVLLAHLYEQEGSPRKALKSNLLAIKAFDQGVKEIDEARRLIARQEVPREYIENLQVVIQDSDWYGVQPSLAYEQLTPFLIDLLSSNVFNETLKELSDLYAIQNNLEYWLFQANEHLVILREAEKKSFTEEKRKLLKRIAAFKDRLSQESAEIKLNALTLKVKDQKRLSALVQNTNKEIALLKDKILQLKNVEEAYKQPSHYKLQVASKHAKIKARLKETKKYIAVLEPVVRSMVNAELKKHEERMRYYWAQSRLAKARLYDTELMNLENAQLEPKPSTKKND